VRIRNFERFLKFKIRNLTRVLEMNDIPKVLASIEFEAGLLNERGMGGGSIDMNLPVIMLLTLKSE